MKNYEALMVFSYIYFAKFTSSFKKVPHSKYSTILQPMQIFPKILKAVSLLFHKMAVLVNNLVLWCSKRQSAVDNKR